MKKIFSYFFVAVLALMTISCSQGFEEQDIMPDVSENLVTMTITVEGEATRTFVGQDGKSICWHEEDKIAIFEGTSSSNKTIREFTVVPGSVNGKRATFVGEVSESATKFFAIYPYEAVVERSGGTYFNVDMPAVQQLKDGNNVADGAIVSIAYFTNTETSFSFNTAVGFLQLNLTFDDITSVEVSGNEIAGRTKFSKSSSTTALPKVNDVLSVENTVTLLPEGEVFTPGTYYVALLPGTTPAGEFSIDFKRKSGTTTLYVSSKEITVERNKGFKTTDKNWEKADFGKISDAQTFVEFIENCANLGDAELACDIDLKGVTVPTAQSYLGTLDGKGYKLKNWNATAPLFQSLGGTVKDLTIDSSCTLAPADAKGAFGFIAAVVEKTGALENITNNVSSITLNATKYGAGSSQTDDAVYFGTLAGKSYGEITGCTNNCDITIATTPTGDDIRGIVYIGGVVGLIDNDMTNCHNTGDIAYTINGRGGYMYMGGVAGGTTTEKLAAATLLKANVTNCSNTGAISHIYPNSATAIGASDSKSNYTYVAGVIGYCEGSVSQCVNGVKDSATKGKVTFTTPTLEADYVVARATVAGVAGLALAGGSNNTNYAPIVVSGSFGPGNDGTGSYLGGGNSKGASVAGVIAQTGVGVNFKSKTLENCHNYGTVNCTFNMASNTKTPHYVGGVVANNMTAASNLTNNAVVTVVSTGNENYLGGVVGNSNADIKSAVNNANLSFALSRTASYHLANVSQYLGGVIGNMTTGSTLKSATNNNSLTFTVSGNPDKAAYFGGVVGSMANGDTLVNNGTMTITDSTVKSYVGGVAAKTLSGTVSSMTNNGAVNYTGAELTNLYVGGVVGSSASTSITSLSNTKSVTVAATDIDYIYLSGVMAETTDDATFTDMSNSGAVTLNAPNATMTNLYAAGVCAVAKNASVFDSCTNEGDMALTATSATKAYFGGIVAASNSTSYAVNVVSSTNSGDMKALFPATWYVGGIMAYGHNWNSTTSKQYAIKDNTVQSDITVDAGSQMLYIGGIVGHSGMQTKYTNNSYNGTISTANSSNAQSMIGGLVGATVLSATSTNTTGSYYNYTFASNSVDATLPAVGYVGALVGGQYNATTSTVKSAPIFKYIFETSKPNTICSATTVNKAVSDCRDDARYEVVIEGLDKGVVFE